MTLPEKIKKLYSELVDADFIGRNSTIILQNDADGKGDYIAEWKHPTLAKPTQEQLEAVKEN
jgi:hypothetical protein